MLTPRFLSPVRLLQAIFITALFVAMSTSAFADRGKDESRGRNDKKGPAVEHKVDTRKGGPPSQGIDTRKGGPVEHKIDTRDSKSRGSEWWRARPGTPQPNPNQKPGGSDWWRAKPQSRTEWKIDTNRPGRYTPQYSPPKRYDPPVRREGRYYYPSQRPSRPYHYGYWAFDNRGRDYCRKSVYFHFGLFPYVQVARVHVLPYVSISYTRVISDRGYYLSRDRITGLDDALDDIRDAWLDGRIDLIERYTRPGQRIAVLLDGRYDYSMDSDDYVEMTYDALDDVRTIGFTWESVRERSDGGYTAFGRHTYRDASGATRTIYVTYTLHRDGSRYVITEVGSSNSALI